MPKPVLTDQDFASAALATGLPIAAIKAVAKVEAPRGGFDAQGRPIILFEGQWFSHFTDGAYDHSHPTISYPNWTKQFYTSSNDGEMKRLDEAAQLEREAALKSASWGKFQIMGFNHVSAGFPDVQGFVNAMYAGEPEHLLAFLNYLANDRDGRGMVLLKAACADGNFTPFALFYNGAKQAANRYDTKLKAAFEEAS